MKNLKKVLGSIRKADNDFGLIEDGDKICVGISGGKDSSVLLYCLYLYQKFSKKDFSIMGIYCDLGFGNEGMDQLIQWFQQYQIDIVIYPTQISEILKLHKKEENQLNECSLCAKLRKGALINAAKSYGCNKIALGHHNDDAVETLFLNMIYGGKVATFDPILFLERSGVFMIRPMIYAFENDIRQCSNQLEIPISKNLCGNDGVTQRQKMKELLGQIYHNYPGAKDNFSLMLRNKNQFHLYDPKNEEKTDLIEK